MSDYAAPLREMRFVLKHVIGLDQIQSLEGHEETSEDLVDAILEEAGKLAATTLAPLNASGDREGARLADGSVTMPSGFDRAYALYRDGGWNAVPFTPEYGGQGLPWTLATAIQEMWHASNMAFGLCPTLNQGAVELLDAHGSPEQKALYLPRLISGRWTGTMNLTEAQAGSDLGSIRTRAERQPDGTYRLFGQKIFITYGEHELAENIIHFVLARTPDAPAGVKGISLFLCPKRHTDSDGNLQNRNDVHCVGLEHKLGIHASPTCVMAFGETEGATSWLIGEEGRGLEYMFTMMNNARLSVGLQGVAIAERAWQQAHAYAQQRRQGRPLDRTAAEGPVEIIRHPDVARMLADMQSATAMCRALAYEAAYQLDRAKRAASSEDRRNAQQRVDLLIPVVKAFCTDIGVEVTSLGIQVHGGMGYIEETGAAQHYRDARIAPIYEGTNGIQANDLMFRKVLRDHGAGARALFADIRQTFDAAAARTDQPALQSVSAAGIAALDALEFTTTWLIDVATATPDRAAAGASRYLRLFGLVTTGWMAARCGLAAVETGPGTALSEEEAADRLTQCRYYADQWVSQAGGLAHAVRTAGDVLAPTGQQHDN